MSQLESELRVVFSALNFAADRHRHQKRKGIDATPYVNHLIAVVHLLLDVGAVHDVDVLVAAVLHDTIEDTDTSAEEIEQRFGERVRVIVEEVSDDKSLPKEERKRLQVAHASSKSREAKLIKLADKISNVTDVCEYPPEGWSDERRGAYVDWAESVVNELRGTNTALEARFDEVARSTRASLCG